MTWLSPIGGVVRGIPCPLSMPVGHRSATGRGARASGPLLGAGEPMADPPSSTKERIACPCCAEVC